MLNEIREYEEYLDINNCKTQRIHYNTFFDEGKCTGIPRIFTILARHYLYTDNDYINPENIEGENIKEKRSKLRKETKSMLQEWLLGPCLEFCISSEKEKNRKEDPEQYISNLLIENKENKGKKTKLARNKYWTSNSIYNSLNSEHNFINAINYDIIIADAIYQGPLRNLCLVLKKSAFDHITYYTVSNGVRTKGTPKLNKSPHNKTESDKFDQFLKYISVTILSLYYGYKFNKTDLSYWTDYPSLANKGTKTGTIFLYKDRPLIEIDSLRKGLEKWRINPDFMSAYDVQLMPMDEAKIKMKEDDYKDYLFFEDKGAEHMQPLS